MKVSIGMLLRSGSWGGGNQFGHALVDYLHSQSVEVRFDLSDPDLDIIVLFDPRENSETATYNDRDIIRYLRRINPDVIVVHRINECDERKGTSGINRRLMEANHFADHTVFVSSWLQNLYLSQGIACKSYSVILNGSERRIFNSEGYHRWDGKAPLRLVTHHWGANWFKGFDIYGRLDDLLSTQPYQSQFNFTYIGRLPEGFAFKNATYVSPMYGHELAQALRSHHVYLTASQNEPGPNHQNEGANCGLPLLYRPSGGLTEYCEGYGISFSDTDFERKLFEMCETYGDWADKVRNYPHTASVTVSTYYKLFAKLLGEREAFISQRKWNLSLGKRIADRFVRFKNRLDLRIN